jgi:hypothetical protein
LKKENNPSNIKNERRKKKRKKSGFMIDGSLSCHFLHPFNLKNHKEVSE